MWRCIRRRLDDRLGRLATACPELLLLLSVVDRDQYRILLLLLLVSCMLPPAATTCTGLTAACTRAFSIVSTRRRAITALTPVAIHLLRFVSLGSRGRPGCQQNRVSLDAVRRRGCQRALRRGKAPLFHVGFDKDKATLTEVDMDLTGAIGADGREEIPTQAGISVFQFASIAGEEEGACAVAVTDADHVAVGVRQPIRLAVKGRAKVFASVVGKVADRVTIPSYPPTFLLT